MDPVPPVSIRYTVAVRALCDFTARRGDLDSRFSPVPTGQQGVAGHGIIAARRGPDYQREITLQGEHGALRIRGRADGFDPRLQRLEEFKTYRGELTRMAANKRELHWAQLMTYGALLCRQRRLAEIRLALVYFDIKTEEETVFERCLSADELERQFTERCAEFLGWALQEVDFRARRDHYLTALAFPHEALRGGQRELAEAAYRNVLRRTVLMVQAPTGVGKTIGTLFPVLKALPRRDLDKVWFLVAKTSGREIALRELRRLLGPTADSLRVLELVAKDAACIHPDRQCAGESCPLAKGFYDRLPAARAAALTAGVWDRDTVRAVAARHVVCPYYLAQELVKWCDVAIGDYNYFFDQNALLHGTGIENEWRVALLVDEAHNLVARARDMWSATLDGSAFGDAERQAPERLRAHLRRVRQEWAALQRLQSQPYQVLQRIPERFSSSLQRAATAISELLAEAPDAVPESLAAFYFDALRFCRLANSFESHSLFDSTESGELATLCIRNVNPAPFLGPRIAGCESTLLFSGTLAPAGFYRQLLGLPEGAAWLDVRSPFDAGQLTVSVARGISTRYHDRPRSLRPIADLIADQYHARPGNYLAFFSSFDYLLEASEVFRERFPDIPQWTQSRGMDAESRAAFLARFGLASRGVAFAVLGGVFAEGIDLPGDRLIGAFIATLGLPQMNPVNAEIERRMQALFAAGYEYTYLYPGLQKVVQAAGRVIRSLADRGCVHLMDDRYLGVQVRGLLPAWWRIECP